MEISIHAPHTGRDVDCPVPPDFWCSFQSTRPIRGATYLDSFVDIPESISIHAPHTGRDSIKKGTGLFILLFQSTRPIRGATFCRLSCPLEQIHFNPRAPYGARPVSGLMYTDSGTFQSTRPIRGATGSSSIQIRQRRNFNPRAPYGARPCRVLCILILAHFNPRAPYGARRVLCCRRGPRQRFQSTRPIRGATTGS